MATLRIGDLQSPMLTVFAIFTVHLLFKGISIIEIVISLWRLALLRILSKSLVQ